ncbi:MAG: hypothetical protein IV100_31520, partial [Myxococcales bacterium]|nr:hypothetical protein [Myxococcales bacterium]
MNTAAHPDAAALIALADSGQWSAVADRVATGATADDAVDATNQHGASLLWLAARH